MEGSFILTAGGPTKRGSSLKDVTRVVSKPPIHEVGARPTLPVRFLFRENSFRDNSRPGGRAENVLRATEILLL